MRYHIYYYYSASGFVLARLARWFSAPIIFHSRRHLIAFFFFFFFFFIMPTPLRLSQTPGFLCCLTNSSRLGSNSLFASRALRYFSPYRLASVGFAKKSAVSAFYKAVCETHLSLWLHSLWGWSLVCFSVVHLVLATSHSFTSSAPLAFRVRWLLCWSL